jgi:c-di-GMP-binding flagellar brake protein YcgR
MTQVDRRGFHRLPIRVPIFIKGTDANGQDFYELTHTVNVSASGACFLSQRELQESADLLISIPAPVDVRESAREDYEFKFPARVVRIENGPQSMKRRVAVRFAKLLDEPDHGAP